MKVRMTVVTESNTPLAPYIDKNQLVVLYRKAFEQLFKTISEESGEKTTVESVELIED